MSAPTLPPLGDVIRRFGLGARKKLGQHFLLDMNLTRRIARAAGDLTTGTTIEIGPGPGGLTRALLEAGAENLIAIEHDQRCIEALTELHDAFPGRLQIIEADALKTDLLALGPGPVRIVANLPYNISTPLLIGWLKNAAHYESMTLMFQKEVADRLNAIPKTKEYGRLSVMTQWLAEVKPLFNVDKSAFTPPPKVMSTVVQIKPFATPLVPAPWDAMEHVVRDAFGQRRKMLRQSLKSFSFDFEALSIDPTLRAENLSVGDFARLAVASTEEA